MTLLIKNKNGTIKDDVLKKIKLQKESNIWVNILSIMPSTFHFKLITNQYKNKDFISFYLKIIRKTLTTYMVDINILYKCILKYLKFY